MNRPIAGYRNQFLISMILTPGADAAAQQNSLASEGDFLPRIDPTNYQKLPVSDAQGQIVFPALIPGATYRIADDTAGGTAISPFVIRRELKVKASETRDVGDIVIEKALTHGPM